MEQADAILRLAGKAGVLMLANGGEIYRVEETMCHFCKAYGAARTECVATPTSIVLSVVDADGKVHTLMRRIQSRSVDLYKVEAVNSLSRSLLPEPPSPDAVSARLREIEAAKPYPTWAIVVASGFAAAGFTVVFGGGLAEFLCAIPLGALQRALIGRLSRLNVGPFVLNLAGGIFAALAGWLAAFSGLCSSWWVVTISVLMLLVPGIVITNGLRDIATGDLVSGITRIAEAFCIAVALATGAAAVYALLKILGVFPL